MSERSGLRLLVVKVLVLSLFATLFTRLWYVQVVGGEAYQAQAQENAVREVIVPPARGLIVDDMGRPLVANRTAWVVTIDRTVLDKLGPHRARALLHRVARVTRLRYADVAARTKLCGEPGAEPPPSCWNGSPYQPVSIAEDVPEQVALAIQEQAEDFPGVLAEERKVRAYPSPFGVNAAHVLGYLSPITAAELRQAERRGDDTVNPISLVGRAGLESQYDRYLRGVPGQREVSVDSMGRPQGNAGFRAPHAGHSLVTSIDARLQGVVERQLTKTIRTARRTVDPETGGKYAADSGAVVVMDATNGRVLALASHPTYDPDLWVGGISTADLARLYSERAGVPLLSRATQGEFAPGSTFKPITAAAALTSGYTPKDELNCTSSLTVGDRVFNNYESLAYGYLNFAEALQLSCDTFFYRIAYANWQRAGADSGDLDAKDPIVEMAKAFGFGRKTGVDLPGEASGRIADRHWKRDYWQDNKDYYCRVGKQKGEDFLHVFAREFCVDGWRYRAGDAVNFAIGQGDTALTPLQLAVAYAALSNGGTLWEPRVAKAIVASDGQVVRRIPPQRAGRVPVDQRTLRYLDRALLGTAKVGTTAGAFLGFPLDKVKVRSKTGTAEVYGKQTTSWLASYDKRYVVVMMVSQAGTGAGTSGPAVRRIWERLYGVHGDRVRPDDALLPGAEPPTGLPRLDADGSIRPPAAPGATGPGR